MNVLWPEEQMDDWIKDSSFFFLSFLCNTRNSFNIAIKVHEKCIKDKIERGGKWEKIWAEKT